MYLKNNCKMIFEYSIKYIKKKKKIGYLKIKYKIKQNMQAVTIT